MVDYKEFFSSQGTPRWQIMLFGFMVFAAGLAQNEFYYQRTVEDSEVQAQQQRIDEKVAEIRQHSVDFQSFAGAFVAAILDNTGEEIARKTALIENILAQDAAIDLSANILGPAVVSERMDYRRALLNMKSAVDQVSDVVSLSVFWGAAADLLLARNKLLEAMDVHAKKLGT